MEVILFFLVDSSFNVSLWLLSEELDHLLSSATNYAEGNPLVQRGVLPGSSADNSQILSTAIGVENKAIVFLRWLCVVWV